MSNIKNYPIAPKFTQQANISELQYHQMYTHSIIEPDNFWGQQANQLISWFKPWEKVSTGDFTHMDTTWFINGKLNVCYNCIDRHLPTRANHVALLWEGNEPQQSLQLTYAELFEKICRFSNVLKKQGVQKGDRVAIYLPMIPEAVVAMLACARIGAVHSVIFGGFSSDAIKNRLLDADCKIVITASDCYRGNKIIPLKHNIDTALLECPDVKSVIVVKHTENVIEWNDHRDYWYHEEINSVSVDCPCEEMDAQDPLFILYTSGSTGKPKGILHVTGGYLTYVATTFKYIFDYHDNDIFWCTADVGWITGHSYVVYGPLCNGATSLLFEGIPNYPNPSRYWEIVDKYKVTIIYTSPTAIRALRHEGDHWVTDTNRKSLRLLGSVGEPINPDVWEWYYTVIGHEHCPIVDTWWQTETGGIMISPFPGAAILKPGAASWPFFGIKPAIIDDHGNKLPADQKGKLVITQPWPGMAKTIYNNPDRFFNAYFKDYPGYYLTGDDARCDADGYYWILGRNDDVLKVSGHRISTAEVENAILADLSVSEAAVVPIQHEIKGEAIYAFVTLKMGIKPNESLKKEIIQKVRENIGAIAAPDHIQWADALPKTRSGKIMRRLLRKIADNDLTDLGDTTTLTDPSVIDRLIRGRQM
jgi:acetyl-CoA synthetase